MVFVARTAFGFLLVALLAWAGPALGQPVEITAPTPSARQPEPIIIPPGDHGQATRPSDADYYPMSPLVRHDPAFIAPLSSKTESPGGGTGRAGISGWTAPNTPVGSAQAHREVSGWFAFGLTFEWGGPPPPAKRPDR
jgi:hypothetical protein